MRRTLISLILIGLIAAGCGEPANDPGAGGNRTDSYLGTWVLVQGTGPKGDIQIPEGDSRITLIITADSIGGIAACNSYGSDSFTIDGNDFDAGGGVSMTEMACAEDLMTAEYRYTEAFTAADHIERDGDTLTLTGPDVELIFEFVPPPQTAELVGTTWILETILLGSGGDGVAMSAEPAELRLDEDGTATGTTGCRDISGEWQESGDQIVFTTFSSPGDCSDNQEQDGYVVSIGDGFTFTIEGDTLTVNPTLGDADLVYRVQG